MNGYIVKINMTIVARNWLNEERGMCLEGGMEDLRGDVGISERNGVRQAILMYTIAYYPCIILDVIFEEISRTFEDL